MSTIYQFSLQQTRKYQHYRDPCYALREPEQCYNGSIEDPLDPEQRRAKVLERIRDFRLMDDDFMSVVFEDKASAELLLRIILERDDLTVRTVQCQRELKNLQGRSVRIDIYAEDREGNAYNVEIQRNDKGAGLRRARYNSSLMDASITDPGDDYNTLAETYVIFITENDVLHMGLPIYHIDRSIRETNQHIDDGSHIIYVNSQIRDDTALGRLMHDFWCRDYKDMHYPVLAERVRHFKTEEEGIQSMCKAMEELCDEVAVAAERRRSIQIARTMLSRDKDSVEEISEITGLTLEEVQALAERQPA